MTAASDYLENELLDHVLKNTAYTSPTNVYLALYSAAPSDAGGGTELTGNGYARQAIAFGVASGGTSSNTAAVTFTASGGDWSAATHYGIFDAATVGNLLIHGALPSSQTVLDGNSLEFPIGDIDVSLD